MPTASLDEALSGAPIVIAAVPSHGMRHVLRDAAPLFAAGAVVVSATKGLETDSLDRMSQVMAEEDRRRASGGGAVRSELRARSRARACRRPSSSRRPMPMPPRAVQHALKGPTLRLYGSDDVAGVEFGGALKNVIAIAAGVVEGLGIGHNAMAALITRGLVEMSRLACAEGSRRETLAGLSGLGDLVLTCTGDLSRNRRVGIELGRGRPLRDILAETRMVAEGVRTTGAALALGARHGVELPLAAQMAAVLEGGRRRARAPSKP